MRAFLFLMGAQMKRVLQHRSNAIAWVVVSGLRIVVGLAIIFTIYSYIPDIEGIDQFTCVLIFASYSLVSSLFFTFFAWTLWFSRRYIVDGQMLLLVTKPLSPLIQIVGENFSRDELVEAMTSLALFVGAAAALRMTIWRSLALLGLLVPGVLAVAGLFLIVASISSWIHTIDEGFSPLMTVMDFAQYPTTIYPRRIQVLLRWIIPYSLIAFVPVSVSLGLSFEGLQTNIWWLPVYGVLVFCVGLMLFRLALRRFEATGS